MIDWQFLITMLTFLLASIVSATVNRLLNVIFLISVCLIAGIFALHLLYPLQYADAMWLIGAVFAFAMNVAGAVAGFALGRVVRGFLLADKSARQPPSSTREEDP